MRLIDADALIPMMKYATTDSDIGVFPIKIGFDAIVKVINAQPTIEPRKKGKWTYIKNVCINHSVKICRCSVCGLPSYGSMDFCSRCGADMRGDTND